MGDIQNGHLLVVASDRIEITSEGETSLGTMIEKEFKVSFKDFRTILKPAVVDSVDVIESEKFRIQIDSDKYLDCHVRVSLYDGYIGYEIQTENPCIRVEGGIVDSQKYKRHVLKKKQYGNVYESVHEIVMTVKDLCDIVVKNDGDLNLAFQITFNESGNIAKHDKKMFMNPEEYHADAVIKCKDGSFRAHRNILAARSEYFKAAFKPNMKEGVSGEIEFKEMEMSVCRTILEYIYCEKVEEGEMNLDVLAEAEKMGLVNLKKECSTKLIKDLSTINCVKTMKAADLHRDEELKNTAKQFIINNYEDLSDDTKDALFPGIAREIFESQHKDLPAAKRMRVNQK